MALYSNLEETKLYKLYNCIFKILLNHFKIEIVSISVYCEWTDIWMRFHKGFDPTDTLNAVVQYEAHMYIYCITIQAGSKKGFECNIFK